MSENTDNDRAPSVEQDEPGKTSGIPHATPIGALSIFAGLTDRDQRRIEEQLTATAQVSAGKTEIVARGTPMTHLLILLAGNAHAEMITGEGHAMIVENFHGPEVIATAMLFAPRPHFPVSLIADSTCRYAWLSRDELLSLAQKERSVLEALLEDSGRRTAFLAARLRLTQFATLRQRIAVFVTEEKTRTDARGREYVHVAYSRQELADMFGVARPSLSRELGNMVEDELIALDGADIRIVDRNAIEALVRGCE